MSEAKDNAADDNPADDIMGTCSSIARGKNYDLFAQGMDIDAISQ